MCSFNKCSPWNDHYLHCKILIQTLFQVNFTDWINSLQQTQPVLPVQPPATDSSGAKSVLFNGDLKIVDLTVHGSINDVPFNDLMSSLFLKGHEQNIAGLLLIIFLLPQFLNFMSILIFFYFV